MKERGILFNAAMVRAILNGSKTNTMRPIKDFGSLETPDEWPPKNELDYLDGQDFALWMDVNGLTTGMSQSPFGKVGDRLYVRETFHLVDSWATGDLPCCLYAEEFVKYQQDGWQESQSRDFWYSRINEKYKKFGCIPSIHMPRCASRIDLEITGVKVMRVQDIKADEIMNEGITTNLREHDAICDLKEKFESLWNSIYNNWNDNPWVWSYQFKRIEVK